MGVGRERASSPSNSRLRQSSRHPDVLYYGCGMTHRATVLERAFELARSGQPRRTQDIIAALRREGYSTEQIEGPLLKRQLLNLIKAARSESSDANRT